MALVTTMLQQKHWLEIEGAVTKWSQCLASVCEIRSVCMFLLGSAVAGFGGNWKTDASDEESEKPYL